MAALDIQRKGVTVDFQNKFQPALPFSGKGGLFSGKVDVAEIGVLGQ
jgi:hypothetical protein